MPIFFLELLPGPRDRDGLPDSLRLWKTRIEEADATFSVGLIYGPSGCGKSSLVKAGLLPRLSPQVTSIYLEATADDTESRLLRELRKRFPECSPVAPRQESSRADDGESLHDGRNANPAFANVSRSETATLNYVLAALRRGQHLPAGKKLLIVLDQFEQWLHAHRDEQNSALVQALRQCDGGRVQCIVMVRDDFWLAVSRFLRELEIRLLEGDNCALADLFDADHARKVLSAFGRAYGRLGSHHPPHDENLAATAGDPRSAAGPPAFHHAERDDYTISRSATAAFLEQAIAGLAEEGKVVSVRLALFAEMMPSLDSGGAQGGGGAAGVGATFLEETFSARTASPEHRYHQKAARAVLAALLSETGSNIKGDSRSYQELLAASGYDRRADDFDHLMRILDSELRLITPTVVDSLRESMAAADTVLSQSTSDEEGALSGSPSTRGASGLHYQLTHDYLAPSLRDWLTRKQRETRRGRAELRLAERSAHWNARPVNRRLPALWEDLNIRLFTGKRNWTEPQPKMMRQAARVHGVRGVIAAGLLLIAVMAGVTIRARLLADREKMAAEMATAELESDRSRADSLVNAALTASPEAVPYAIENLKPLATHVVPILKASFSGGDLDRFQRLHAALALAAFDHYEQGCIIESMCWAGRGEYLNVIAALQRAPASAVDNLKQQFTQAAAPDVRARLAVVLLHLGDANAAQNALELGPDPTTRTAFTLDLEKWLAAPADYVEPLRTTQDSAFRSGLILAAGRIADHGKAAAKLALTPMLLDLFQKAPDGATHSACGWTLRQWKVELPATPPPSALHPPSLANWFVNSQGQTMLKIPPGSFSRKDTFRKSKETIVTLTKAFYLCDREVSMEQFQRFVDDSDYPAAEKPQKWPGVHKEISPTGAHPVQQVSWYDAVLYCNWLSRNHALTPCYERTGEKEKAALEKDAKGQPVEYGAWRLVEGAAAYRLPTEAEWEYACRPRATTQFGHGDDDRFLPHYAAYVKSTNNTAQACGGKLPNAWGFFDMHGNVWEWCHDWYADYMIADRVEDSVGVSDGTNRLFRGGSWDDAAWIGAAGIRGGYDPAYRDDTLGFRVALVPTSK